jgi:myosin-15
MQSSSAANGRQDTVTVKAQVHRSQSPPKKGSDPSRKSGIDFGARKISAERKIANAADVKRTGANKGNVQNNFTNVLSELKNRKSSVEGPASLNNKGVPPPPPMPPPLESHDPSESRPFIDPYGRAKTVRIGKWRWDNLLLLVKYVLGLLKGRQKIDYTL